MVNIRVPTIYFWEESYNDKPTIMTAAFKWKGVCFGESFPIDDTKLSTVRKKADKNKLIEKVKEALDVLIHHGKRVLDDGDGNIDPRKVNDAEAERFYLDPGWRDKVIALRQIMLVRKITREQAVQLGLL